MGDDEEEEENDDDQIEELATEENQPEVLSSIINPRSNSVTGKYSEHTTNRPQGNLMGAGALASAASQNIQPSLEGFGGIVGVSAAGGGKSKPPPTSV